jgi:hypothetical protein
MSYITTYPPSGAHVFNVAWTVLHTLQERIHALCKSPQDTPRSSHHPVGGYLPSYLVVGASLQKVNVENKSLLACHQLRLL